ncbi:hypothetical protein [Aliivibrio logei]|nr:hypothetical protein [Aliivibrio logei]
MGYFFWSDIWDYASDALIEINKGIDVEATDIVLSEKAWVDSGAP